MTVTPLLRLIYLSKILLGVKLMSNTYTTGQVAKRLGEDHRNQVNRIMKYMGMNLEKNERGHYIIDDESLDLIRMYADFKKNVKITYKDFNELENIIKNVSSKVEAVQRAFDILVNYDNTASNISTKKLFYITCSAILGLSHEKIELLETITGVYPDENETLISMYNYFLYQAYVIDILLNLSTLELEPEEEFWDLDVVKGYETYIFNIVFNRPPITENINEFFMCVLMKKKYDAEAKNNLLIKKLTVLLKELNKFYDENNLDYDKCQLIFLHAIQLLSLTCLTTLK
ncbi:hypothetical protein B5V89_17860 [Heyndrickxia sporothermodurans]|uniref:hypothetical protein n=1 Tax=Heyndrickxia sporothermodurans TaxID=46224 RepID=UPI000D3CDBCF|nr:hypothetical protein [Heyndrickxia sporothermodurans]PTY76502.1 hypothetical protein B5V89_17860 [Heyndrickxia sporothermodurans]